MDKETVQEDEQERPYSEYSDEELLNTVQNMKVELTKHRKSLFKKEEAFPSHKNDDYLKEIKSLKKCISLIQASSEEISFIIEDRQNLNGSDGGIVKKQWTETQRICSQIDKLQKTGAQKATEILDNYNCTFPTPPKLTTTQKILLITATIGLYKIVHETWPDAMKDLEIALTTQQKEALSIMVFAPDALEKMGFSGAVPKIFDQPRKQIQKHPFSRAEKHLLYCFLN